MEYVLLPNTGKVWQYVSISEKDRGSFMVCGGLELGTVYIPYSKSRDDFRKLVLECDPRKEMPHASERIVSIRVSEFLDTCNNSKGFGHPYRVSVGKHSVDVWMLLNKASGNYIGVDVCGFFFYLGLSTRQKARELIRSIQKKDRLLCSKSTVTISV